MTIGKRKLCALGSSTLSHSWGSQHLAWNMFIWMAICLNSQNWSGRKWQLLPVRDLPKSCWRVSPAKSHHEWCPHLPFRRPWRWSFTWRNRGRIPMSSHSLSGGFMDSPTILVLFTAPSTAGDQPRWSSSWDGWWSFWITFWNFPVVGWGESLRHWLDPGTYLEQLRIFNSFIPLAQRICMVKQFFCPGSSLDWRTLETSSLSTCVQSLTSFARTDICSLSNKFWH